MLGTRVTSISTPLAISNFWKDFRQGGNLAFSKLKWSYLSPTLDANQHKIPGEHEIVALAILSAHATFLPVPFVVFESFSVKCFSHCNVNDDYYYPITIANLIHSHNIQISTFKIRYGTATNLFPSKIHIVLNIK